MNMEQWKSIHEFPNYEISNYGRVRSLSRTFTRPHPCCEHKIQTVTTKQNIILGWLRKPKKNSPYRSVYVALRSNNKTLQIKISHLVLEAFSSKRENNMYALHIDGNSENNHVNNLKWGTALDNTQDSIIHGTNRNPPVHFGDTHPNAKFKKDDIIKIRSIPYVKGLFKRLSIEYKCLPITISRIYKNKLWKHIEKE